jgi:hypothetical protein
MLVSNGELFIKLNVAARAFYYYDLCFCEPSNEHFEHLETSLSLYIFINGIGDILSPSNPNIDDNLGRVPKKINGMCVVQVNYPSYELATHHGVKPNISLKTSPFVENINQELIGYSFMPIDKCINYDNYFDLSYVHLTKFLNHAKEVGVSIDANFLEEIIINDNRFTELKRLSKQQKNVVFNLNQAADIYLPYFEGVLTETIIEGCALASAQFDRVYKIKENKLASEVIKNDIYKISEIFNRLTATSENIEQFKNTLPDNWREALFNYPENNIQHKTVNFDDDDTPDMLYIAHGVYKDVWLDFNSNTTNMPPKASIEEIIKKKGVKGPKDIAAIIRLSTPNGLKLGGKPSAEKKNWLPVCKKQVE